MSKEYISRKYHNWEKSGIKKDSSVYEHRSSEIAKFTFLRLLPAMQIINTYGKDYVFRGETVPHHNPFLYGDFKSYCQIALMGMTMMAFGNENYPYGFRFNTDHSIDVVLNPDLGHFNLPSWTKKHATITPMNGYFREVDSFVPSQMNLTQMPHFINQIYKRVDTRHWPIILFGNLTSPVVSAGYEVPWERQIVNSRSVKRKDRIRVPLTAKRLN